MRGSCKGEELCQWWKNGDVNIEIGQLNDKRLLDSESLGCRVGKKIYGLLTLRKTTKISIFCVHGCLED